MANPQTPSTGAGASNNNLTPNTNLRPITKIRLLPSRNPITPPTTNTNTPSLQPKQTKLKLKASSSASVDAASRRRKQHRGSDAGISPARPPKEPKTVVQAAGANLAAGTETTGTNATGTGTAGTAETGSSNWSPRRRIHHWLNQQVSIHLDRLRPSSSFAIAARLGAAATKKPRILLNTQNIRWIQAKNGAWVKTSLLTSKEELALQKTKTFDDGDNDVDMSE
ncbi:hypothetical protein BDP55DRAFT_627558 [Colletotrichum godetiae]|uniref:Uncharacterized protein n=1 Tax=Colletotrichum godetiae TaxID=1209918 RepID=A0AAJ0AV09_9PEZI|nr:uncharacterized protein BDP55DRAFT_627558 [Colletotrichum godetiae]KAK1690869.1 hypothetical protein BDP55DRAFT_627558 [Colletotrichum godetiae]